MHSARRTGQARPSAEQLVGKAALFVARHREPVVEGDGRRAVELVGESGLAVLTGSVEIRDQFRDLGKLKCLPQALDPVIEALSGIRAS